MITSNDSWDDARRAGSDKRRRLRSRWTQAARPKGGPRVWTEARRRCPPRVDERSDVLLRRSAPAVLARSRPRASHPISGRIAGHAAVVRQFDITSAAATLRRRVQGRHPLQTSEALGAAAAQLGAEVIALVVVLNKTAGTVVRQIVTLLQQLYGLTVTRSGLVHAVEGRRAVAVALTFATRDTTIYRIQPGRGFDEAAAVLGSISPVCSCVMAGRRIASLPTPPTKRVSRIAAPLSTPADRLSRARSSSTSRASCTTRWPCAIALAPAPSRRMASLSPVAVGSQI